jgi:hypothetical protein
MHAQCPVHALPLADAGQLIGVFDPSKGRVRCMLPSSFLHDLAFGLVPIFMLELCLVS